MSLDTMAKDFLAQKRIAVSGVSHTKTDSANMIFLKLKESGHEVFAVNPNAEKVEGETCYPSVKAIPGGVDGVVIINKPQITEQVVRDCAEAGVKRVWMHNNTMAGSSVSPEAVKFAKEHGISVIDGACPMMWMDFGHKCMRFVLGAMGRLPNPN